MKKSERKNFENVLKKKKYNWLITGVAGFIGSNILEKLLFLNQKVLGIDNFSTGSIENLKDVEKIVGKKDGRISNFIKEIYQIYEIVERYLIKLI